MRRYLHIILFTGCIVLSHAAFAQPDRDKVEVLRVAFITKLLELSAQESEKFWPVYNEYSDKIHAVKKNLRQSYKAKGENPSENDAEELYRMETQTKQAELDLFKQYSEKIKQIIGARKFVRLRIAEEQFRHEMIKSIREKNEGR